MTRVKLHKAQMRLALVRAAEAKAKADSLVKLAKLKAKVKASTQYAERA